MGSKHSTAMVSKPIKSTHPTTKSAKVTTTASKATPRPKKPFLKPKTKLPRKEWRDAFLTSWPLGLLLATFIGLLATILGLTIRSAQNKGLGTVPSIYPTLGPFTIGLSITWIVIPNVVFTLVNIWFGVTVTALANRQPYIELAKPQGAPAKSSILLNYQTKNIFFTRWFDAAFRLKHITIAISTFSALLFTVILVPLSSHLLTSDLVVFDNSTSIVLRSSYNTDNNALPTNLNFRSVFSISAATLIYGGQPLPWTTIEYAFQNFSTPDIPTDSSSTNVSVQLTGYSANLDCVSMPINPTTTLVNSIGNGAGSITYANVDRGCYISWTLSSISNKAKDYLQTYPNISCLGFVGYSRLGIIAAQYDANSPQLVSNLSVISCIPSYKQTNGTLNVNLGITSSPLIKSFVPSPVTPAQDGRPGFWRQYEQELHQNVAFDQTADLSASDFGQLIFSYATANASTSYFNSTLLISGTSQIFTSIYSVFVATHILQQTSTPSLISTATIYYDKTRLLVYPPIAYTLLVTLFCLAILTGWIWIYSERKTSILYEEPSGLLSYAGILADSGLIELAREEKSHGDEYDGKLEKMFKTRKGWPNDTKFKVAEANHPSQMRIIKVETRSQP